VKAGSLSFIVALATVVALVVATPGVAGNEEAGGYHYASAVDPGTGRFKVAVDCPPHTHLVAPAGKTNGTYGETALTSIYPKDDGDADKKPDDIAAAQADDFVAPQRTLKVRATCARGKFKYVDWTIVTPSEGYNFASAICPAGTQVTGGGVRPRGGFGTQYPVSTRPIDLGDADNDPDNGWLATVYNASQTSRRSTIYAICGKGSYSYAFPQNSPAAAGAQQTVQTPCPADTITIGGGTDTSGPPSTVHINTSASLNEVASPDPAPDDAWSSTVDNSDTSEHPVSTYAICGKPLG
jgi:hypothetical protein